jgi:acetyl-CoA acetyltransferase
VRELSIELLGDVLLALLRRNELPGDAIDRVVGGCVNQLGTQASNVVCNAWLGARLGSVAL